MELKNRLYPYPVYTTSNEDNDYLVKPLEVKVQHNLDLINQQYNLEIDFDVFDNALNEEIRKGTVQFVTHLECPNTNYFKLIQSKSNKQSIQIDLKSINQTVQLVTFLVVIKEIDNFNSINFKGIFKNSSFYFERGNIIGVGDSFKITIQKNINKIANINSIFEINYHLNNNKNYDFRISPDENKIHINLPKKHFEFYAGAMHNPSLKPTLDSLFIFPTLVSLLGKIQNEESLNIDSIWVKTIVNSYKKKTGEEIDLENRKTIDPFVIAQQLYDSPVINSFEYILKVGEEKNYGEE
jgi:hypothetical protein